MCTISVGCQKSWNKIKWNFNFILLKCYTGTYWNRRRICSFFIVAWGREADTRFRIFRPIDWYHSLLPRNNFCRVIWDLDHFLVSLFWPVTWKRLIFQVWFRFWGPIFFQFPIRLPIHFFWIVPFFGKTTYLALSVGFILLRILHGQKKICFGKKRWYC